MSSGRVRLGEFHFDLATGEVTPVDRPEETVRLAPQPATLLRLLIEKRGGLLVREEVRQSLWPDAHVDVDVDQALSFCVRQVRAALGDSAGEPRYLETLPRRGYRLLVQAREEAGPTASGRPGTAAARRWPWAAIPLALLVAGLLAWTAARRPPGPPPAPLEPAVRLGIMPFAPPPEVAIESDTTRIAEHLLVELGSDLEGRLGVVGPRSTAAYDDSASSLKRLARDYELDYILNGRFLETPEGPALLAELIRVEDGVHVWVERFSSLADVEAIAEAIDAAVRSRLGGDPSRISWKLKMA